MVIVNDVVHCRARRPRFQGLGLVVCLAERFLYAGIAPIADAVTGAFDVGPAVIASGLEDVELVGVVLAMFAAVDHAIGADAKALAVAVPFGEHVACGVGIVCRDTAIQVESKDFAVVAVVSLRFLCLRLLIFMGWLQLEGERGKGKER